MVQCIRTVLSTLHIAPSKVGEVMVSIKSCCGKPIAFSYRKMPSLCFGICARISDGIIVVFAYIRHCRSLYLEMPEWFCIFVEEADGLVLCLWSLSYWLLYSVVLIGVSATLASVRRSLSTYQSLGNNWSLSLDVFSDSWEMEVTSATARLASRSFCLEICFFIAM